MGGALRFTSYCREPLILAIAIIALLVAACSHEPSEVFVPGASFVEAVRLSTAQGELATVRVGEALLLHAERTSGPWVAVARDSLQPDACWLASAPPEREAEVADNITWLVEPPGTATFNLGLRHDRAREVRFAEPGLYRISARSHAWCGSPYQGNPLSIRVLPR